MTTDPRGYVLRYVGKTHHLADCRGYAYEHRLVAERKMGRRLRPREVVHHEKENGNNKPKFLEVFPTNAAHLNATKRTIGFNRRKWNEANPKIKCKCGCGETFLKFDSGGRPRKFINGHNPPDRSRQEAFIKACGKGSQLDRVASKTGQSIQACKCMASKLVSEGKLDRIGRGIYGRKH